MSHTPAKTTNQSATIDPIVDFDTLYDTINVGIGIYDNNGILIDCNAALLRIFGIEDKQAWLAAHIKVEQDPNFLPTLTEKFHFDNQEVSTIHYNFDLICDTHFYKSSNRGFRTLEIRSSRFAKNNAAYVLTILDVTESKAREIEEIEKKSTFKTDLALKNANMVMWEYCVQEQMFIAFNDPLTNYDKRVKYTPEKYIQALDSQSIKEAERAVDFMNRQQLGEFSFKSKIMLPNSTQWQYITVCGSHSEVSEEDPTKAVKYVGFRINHTELVQLSQNIEESNKLTESILSQSPSAIFIKDITDEWRYVIANDLFCQLFNYVEDQIIGYTDHEIFDFDVAERFRADDLKALSYEDIYSFVEEITTDGKIKALHTTKRVITTANGRQLLIGITSDITETIAQQRALEEANTKSELVLNNANSGLIYIDNNFLIIWENTNSIHNNPHIHQYKRGGICYQSIHGRTTPCPDCVILQAQRSGHTEKQTKFFDDGMVVDIFATPVFDEQEQVNGYVCRVDNVTQDVQKNRQLERTQQYLDLAIDAGKVGVWGYNPKQDTVFNISGKVFLEDVLPLSVANTYVHPDDMPIFGAAWQRLISGESNNEMLCLRFISPFTGELEYVDKSITTLRTSTGELEMIIGTHHDVTKEKIQKLALEDSNEKLSMALGVIESFSWHYDERSPLLHFDSTFTALGYDAERLNSIEKVSKYVHSDYREEFLSSVAKFAAQSQGEFLGTYLIDLGGNGNYEWWECRGKIKIMSENGKTYKYIYGMNCNVTRHQQITDELQKNKDRAEEANSLLHSIIKQIPFGLYIKDIDNDFRYLIMNDVLAKIDRIDNKQAIGKTDYELFDKDIADIFHNEHVLTCSKPDGELTVVKSTINWHGEMMVFENSNTAITVANGRHLLVGVVSDVTEKEQMLNELKVSKERAEQSDKLKSAFLANMSHEIRTPLNAIVGFSELLIEAEDAAEREEYTNIISVNNELLLRLIGDILDLSKIESGMIELKSEKFDLSDICDEVYMMLKQKATNPEIDFAVSNPYTQCFVELDKNRLKQVGINFITNAIKYTARGKITMGYEAINNGIRIYVQDTGIGIAPENHDKVFKRFEKFDSFAQGTGLGLSICKAIIDAQGGEIGFESQAGVGSTFWAWFPCSVEINQGETSYAYMDQVNERFLAEEAILTEGARKILIAEDNDSNYMLMRHILKNENVTRAVNGAEALAMAQAEKYHAILMDWEMPIMNGLEATRAIRLFDKKTPIIAVSANVFDENRALILQAGCNSFVAKPLKKQELFDALKLIKS